MTRVVCYIRQSDEEGHKKDLSCPCQERRFLHGRRGLGQTMGRSWSTRSPLGTKANRAGRIDRDGLQWVLANLDRFHEVWVYDHDRLIRHAVLRSLGDGGDPQPRHPPVGVAGARTSPRPWDAS